MQPSSIEKMFGQSMLVAIVIIMIAHINAAKVSIWKDLNGCLGESDAEVIVENKKCTQVLDRSISVDCTDYMFKLRVSGSGDTNCQILTDFIPRLHRGRAKCVHSINVAVKIDCSIIPVIIPLTTYITMADVSRQLINSTA